MYKGQLSNNQQILWVLSSVIFKDDGVLKEEMKEWLDRATLVSEIVVLLKPGDQILDHEYDVSYKIFRSLADAQKALTQDPRPIGIIAHEGQEDRQKETYSFCPNILTQIGISMR